MRRHRRSNVLPRDGVSLKKRIKRTRRRAKWVGMLYLLGIIAFAAAACLPLLVHDLAPIGVMTFWKTFTNMDLKSPEGLTKVINSGLYALMLLGIVINVLRALGKLGWLFKKSASKTYGFNRNVYAMEDLGRIFSGSYLVIFVGHFLIALLCGEAVVNLLMLITLGGGAVIHLFAGFWGGKVGYFDIENMEVVEQRRIVGRIAPFIRNLFQIAAVVVIAYCILEVSTLNALLEKSELDAALKNMDNLIMLAVQAVTLLCSLVLIKHTFSITEYNIDGHRAPGMKNFRIFTFLIFLVAGAGVGYKYFVIDKTWDIMLLIMAGTALVSFIIERIMRKMPKSPDDKLIKKEKKQKYAEEEFTFENLPKPVPNPQAQQY